MPPRARSLLALLLALVAGCSDAERGSSAGGASGSAGRGPGGSGGSGQPAGSGGTGSSARPSCEQGFPCEPGLRCAVQSDAEGRDCTCGPDGRFSCTRVGLDCFTGKGTYTNGSLGCTSTCTCADQATTPICAFQCGAGHGCLEDAPCSEGVRCLVASPEGARRCECDGSALRCSPPDAVCAMGAFCSGGKTCSAPLDSGCELRCSCHAESYACETFCPFCPPSPPACGSPCSADVLGKSCLCDKSGACVCLADGGAQATWRCCPPLPLQDKSCEGFPEGFSCGFEPGSKDYCVCKGGTWSNCIF